MKSKETKNHDILREDDSSRITSKHNDSTNAKHQKKQTNENFGIDLLNEKSNSILRHILVLINPISGTGKSLAVYNKNLSPALLANKITHEVFISQDTYRVSDFIQGLDVEKFQEFSSIVVVAGDGLLHETLNAIHKRSDSIAATVPLGIVPTGSGNGLAYTLIRRHRELVVPENGESDLDTACKLVVDGNTCRADLVKIEFNNKTIWSFLSIGWGVMADIDIESEVLRKFGEIRFTIFGLIKCITGRAYKGKLSYKIATPSHNPLLANTEYIQQQQRRQDEQVKKLHSKDSTINKDDDGWTYIDDIFTCVYAVYQTHISKDAKFSPNSKLSDELIYLTIVRGKLSVLQTAKFLLSMKDGSHEKLDYVSVLAVKAFKLLPEEASRIVVDGEQVEWKAGLDGTISASIEPEIVKFLSHP